MFNGNTSATTSVTSRRGRAGRADIGYRLAMVTVLVCLVAATPWLQLSFQGNDPFSQLIDLLGTIDGRYLLLGAAVLAGLVAVIGVVALLVSIMVSRSPVHSRQGSPAGQLSGVREQCSA